MEPFDSLGTNNSLARLTADSSGEESHYKFLRFALGSQDSGLLPLEQISEVLSFTPTEILPVPEMPSCVLGIYNWRGKMLWLIDLNSLIDYPPFVHGGRESEPLTAMVIQMNSQSMGLVVQCVNDIERHDATQIQNATAGLFPPKLLQFVKGYLPSANSTVLDAEAIARFPLWQLHRS